MRAETISRPDRPQKAAMFMLAAGEDHAGKLFALMDVEEIKEMSQAMARLGRQLG